MSVVILVSNGLTINSFLNQKVEFLILNPELALIRFVLQHGNIFEERIFISQATYPVRSSCLYIKYVLS